MIMAEMMIANEMQNRRWIFMRLYENVNDARVQADQITVARAMVKTSPTTEMIVSAMDQLFRVCATLIPKYSLTSQNPPSLKCEKISEPAPVAMVSSSGRTPV